MPIWITKKLSKNLFRRDHREEAQGKYTCLQQLDEQCTRETDGFGVFSQESWRAVAASEIGAAHVLAETPCQDACGYFIDSGTLIACVADGAGSARYSDKGSRAAVDEFVSASRDLLKDGTGHSLTDIVSQAFEKSRMAVLKIAEGDPREYATTLLGIVAQGNALAAVQVGDGAIVVDGEVVLDSYSEHHANSGEYSNETRFVTEPNASPTTFSLSHKVTRVAMLTDGLENIALEDNGYQRLSHAQFFDPMYEWLKHSDESNRTAQLCEFLASDRVRAKTTDDVTLLLAMR